MLEVNPFNQHIAARLLEFFNSATQWQRRLWNIGLRLTLSEILEGSEAVHRGILGAESLQHLTNSAMTLVGLDPGSGDAKQKQILQEALRRKIGFKGLDYLTIRELTKDLDTHYLHRWAVALDDPASACRPERTARAIASHLLDGGFNPDYLHRWWIYRMKYQPGVRSLAELVTEAHELATRPAAKYDILITVESIPKSHTPPPRWLDAPSVSSWLRKHNFNPSGFRQRGGMLFSEMARDPFSAVDRVQEILEKFAARTEIGVTGTFQPSDSAWVVGLDSPLKVGRRPRVVQVHALYREDQIYSDATPSKVDAAIELLAPLASSSPTAAVAGGWAAIEALLSEPNEQKGAAAERMASLVACSFPRAELTPLSYTIERAGGPLVEQIRACETNRDRCLVVARAIQSDTALPLTSSSDTAAVCRMRDLLAEPHIKLRDIETHLRLAFERLYRQRNLVLHGAITDAVALRGCLRTVAPIAGAGIDRIAHAWFVEHVEPLELASRAKIRLALLGPGDGCKCVDLLA